MINTADIRAFQQLTNSDGRLAIVANDQRQSLVNARERAGLSVTIDDMRALKRDIVAALAPAASGVLLDPEISLPNLVDEGVVPRATGLLVAIEHSGAREEGGLRVTDVVLGPADVRRLGGTAAKLLVYVRPDREDLDGPNGRLIRATAAACTDADLLLVVEVLTYALPDEESGLYLRRRPDLIREAAVLAESCGAKVLKLESPGTSADCSRVTSALRAPWAVLSAGVDHETFVGTLQEALEGGACGFIAGRSLWKEAVSLASRERQAFLLGEGCRRLDELLALLG